MKINSTTAPFSAPVRKMVFPACVEQIVTALRVATGYSFGKALCRIIVIAVFPFALSAAHAEGVSEAPRKEGWRGFDAIHSQGQADRIVGENKEEAVFVLNYHSLGWNGPKYQVIVEANGKATFNGISNVKTIGSSQRTLNQRQMREMHAFAHTLVAELEAAGPGASSIFAKFYYLDKGVYKEVEASRYDRSYAVFLKHLPALDRMFKLYEYRCPVSQFSGPDGRDVCLNINELVSRKELQDGGR